MNKYIVYCAFVIVICHEGAKSYRLVEVSDDDDQKIVGGEETTIDNYPYQAYLLLYDGRKNYECGGTIVNKNYIVTAAHCLARIRKITVRIGSTQRNSGGTQYPTTSYYAHPRYDSRTSDYDVAIVYIEDGMDLDGTNSTAISLVDFGNDPEEGDNVVVTGWGDTVENGTDSINLRVVEVPVVARDKCNKLIGGGVTARMFCAGEEGKDSCQGDSGGPAVLTSENKLAGITSYGFGCGRPNSPGVYTRVGDLEIRTFILLSTLA